MNHILVPGGQVAAEVVAAVSPEMMNGNGDLLLVCAEVLAVLDFFSL